jgi:hypothetical protein
LTNTAFPLLCAADFVAVKFVVEESVKNRTLGSIFIVAGTTIGAGMLACRWRPRAWDLA